MLEGDATTVLGLLMHYPSMTSVTPILDYADMIKRYDTVFYSVCYFSLFPYIIVLSSKNNGKTLV